MAFTSLQVRVVLAAGVIAAVLMAPLAGRSQGLIPISSITGGSSVFVFRAIAKAVKRVIVAVKPVRSKAQQIETSARIKRQYEATAKVTPRPNRAKAVTYSTTAVRQATSLPPEQGSKIFAGFGEYYIAQGDVDTAIERFQEAMNLDPKNVEAKTGYGEALAVRGNNLLAKDQAASAKGVFLEALKYDPDNVAANFGLAQVYDELGQQADAIAAYEKSLKNDKELTEIYLPLGVLYYQTGEIAKADELLTNAYTRNPESAETQFFYGLVRAAQNKTEEALKAFQKAKTLDATLADAFFFAGEMLVRQKQTSDAVGDYVQATTLKPGYFDAWVSLGDAQLELKNYAGAILAYTKASKIKNNDWQVFAGLGDAYLQSKDFPAAEANLNLAAIFLVATKDFNKDDAGLLYSKAGLAVGQQCDINIQKNIMCNWPGAIKYLKKAADLTNNPIDQVNLGWAYFRAGHMDAEAKNMAAARPNLELAQTALQAAVAAGPPASEFALQNLAATQIDLGDFKNAIATLNKLISVKPDMTFSKYALGVAYNKSGDLANAEKWLRAASDAEPTNLSYLVGLADTFISRKNGKELQKVIDRIRPLDPALAASLEQRKKLLKL